MRNEANAVLKSVRSGLNNAVGKTIQAQTKRERPYKLRRNTGPIRGIRREDSNSVKVCRRTVGSQSNKRRTMEFKTNMNTDAFLSRQAELKDQQQATQASRDLGILPKEPADRQISERQRAVLLEMQGVRQQREAHLANRAGRSALSS